VVALCAKISVYLCFSTYVPSQAQLYDLGVLTDQLSRCFKKVATLDTQTGELTPFVAQNGDSTHHKLNYAQWQLGIGPESRAVEEMAIYAKTLQKVAQAIKADDPQQELNLWPWQVPYSGLSNNLQAWLAELEPDALVVLTAGPYRGLSTIAELSPSLSATSREDHYSLPSNQALSTTHLTWQERYSLNINNPIFG